MLGSCFWSFCSLGSRNWRLFFFCVVQFGSGVHRLEFIVVFVSGPGSSSRCRAKWWCYVRLEFILCLVGGVYLVGGGIGDGEDEGYIDGGIIIILADDILAVMQVGVRQHHSPMHVVMMRYASFPKRVRGQFGRGTP